jgi:dTDP-4-amino-4,6-dideoxygalactose transaminase
MNREAWSRYSAGGKWAYDIVEPGFKYNMTDLQAALGLQQLRRFDRMQARRKEIVQTYNAAFRNHAAFLTPTTRDHVTNAWHLYVLRLRSSELTINRNQFIEEMTARNIGTSVHFIPIHMHSYYRDKYNYHPNDFPVAHAAFQNMLSLPLSPSMSDQDVADVIDAVLDIRSKFARRRAAA